MARLSASLLAFLAVAGAALGLSACGGGSDAKLLPGTTANQINANLDQVRSYVSEGECLSAEDAVATVMDEVDGLGGVDAKLKAALKEGATRLSEVVAACEEEGEEDEEAEPAVDPAVEAEELEAEQKKEEKRLERETPAEGHAGGGQQGQGQGGQGNSGGPGQSPTPPTQPSGKGEEKGGGPTPPEPESSPSGGIGPSEEAGGG